MALSMFDMALYDALAREAGVPLYKLLGGKAEPLPTYNSCGLGIMEPAQAAREARELVAEHGGFSHVKLRMGRERAADEVAAYRAVRDAVGPDILISVRFQPGAAGAQARSRPAAPSTAWGSPGSRSRSPTTTTIRRRGSPPSSPRPSRSARTGGAGASARRRSRWAPATTSCRTCCASAASPAGCGLPAWPRRAPCRSPRTCRPTVSAHVLAATPTRHWLEFMDWGQDLLVDPLRAGEGLHHAARDARHGRGVEREGDRAAPRVGAPDPQGSQETSGRFECSKPTSSSTPPRS